MATATLDPREQRGIMIAALCKLDRKDGSWIVPSQSDTSKKYTVKLDGNGGKGSCTCPDCTESGFVCKHIRSVRITLKRELGIDGMVTETRQMLFEEKKVYRQEWEAYNRAQTTEKPRFLALLKELCQGVEEAPYKGKGRKPHTAKDSIFAMAYKVYSMFSSRRFHSDLQDAHKQGFISRPIHGVKVCAFFENPAFTPILKALIAKSAAPLAAVEKTFAVDSTGFATSKFARWYSEKWGGMKQKAEWIKAHVACGTKTNVITAVEILDKDAADCPQFAPLVKKTAEGTTPQLTSCVQ